MTFAHRRLMTTRRNHDNLRHQCARRARGAVDRGRCCRHRRRRSCTHRAREGRSASASSVFSIIETPRLTLSLSPARSSRETRHGAQDGRPAQVRRRVHAQVHRDQTGRPRPRGGAPGQMPDGRFAAFFGVSSIGIWVPHLTDVACGVVRRQSCPCAMRREPLPRTRGYRSRSGGRSSYLMLRPWRCAWGHEVACSNPASPTTPAACLRSLDDHRHVLRARGGAPGRPAVPR